VDAGLLFLPVHHHHRRRRRRRCRRHHHQMFSYDLLTTADVL